jgi:hypothetical protein
MKSSLVLELQQRALDDSVSVSSVLRAARVVARKLKIQSIDEWLRHEMDGYPDGTDLPTYRRVFGTVKSDNTPYGFGPVQFPDPETERQMSTGWIQQSIAEVEKFVEGDDGVLMMPRGQARGTFSRRPAYLILERASFHRILERVRNTVLEWALELEAQQVLGEGMSFSAEEIARAQAASTINVFVGDVGQAVFQQGHVQDLSIVHGAELAEVQALVESVASARDELALDGEQRRRLDEALALIAEETKKPEPKKSRVRGAIETLGELAKVGKAGTEIAAAIAKIITMFS